MDFSGLIKQLANDYIPRNHQIAAMILVGCLLALGFYSAPKNIKSELSDDSTATPLTLHSLPENLLTSFEQAEETLPVIEKDSRLITEIKSGDNLSTLFMKAGLTPQDVYKISHSGDDAKILNDLYPGDKLAFDISESGVLNSLEVIKSPLESFVFTSTDNSGYDVQQIIRSPDVQQIYKSATIADSLFLSARRGGISAKLTMALAGIFGGVIDFMLDTREGDTFNVLYEEKLLDGVFIGNGDILATQFTNQGITYTALRYVNLDGESGYYNPRGESMRKAFLRSPINIVRITSGFSLSRRHPILNTIRAHRGTDYAAPRGTEVQATGDGRVSWAARNGSFGKLIVIQHGEQFQTKYAHLSDYARGIKVGARVKQGQIIGYIGTTGSSTGPHLHYEFLMDGVHRNSRTIHDKLPKAESIPASEMQRFREHTQILLARLDAFNQPPTLAQNTSLPDEQ